jgi:excisionase family DNA binding protein
MRLHRAFSTRRKCTVPLFFARPQLCCCLSHGVTDSYSEVQTVEKLLRIPEVARILDLPIPRVYEIVRRGLLPTVRIGRQLRVAPSLLAAFVSKGGTPNATRADEPPFQSSERR